MYLKEPVVLNQLELLFSCYMLSLHNSMSSGGIFNKLFLFNNVNIHTTPEL